MVAVVSIHEGHFSEVPDFERPVITHSVKLIIFFIESYVCDCIAMAHKSLDLLLIVDVPYSDDAVLTSRD